MPTNLFFALELSRDARLAVHRLAERWRVALGERGGIAWYRPEDYHITLKFLGARQACEEGGFVVAGEQALSLLADDLRAHGIPVRAAGAGAFPNLARPRVLWVAAQGTPDLTMLAQRIDDVCAEFGVPRETWQFKPHITVARCRPSAGAVALPSIASESDPAFKDFVQNRFALMRTSCPEARQKGSNLRYNIVQVFGFGPR